MQEKPFLPKIKDWINKNKVLDVMIFGSFVRGKTKPGDVDVCILIKDEDEKKSLDLVSSLGEITDKLELKFHINILTTSAFATGDTLAKTLLAEGYSIKSNKSFASVFSLTNKSLFVYTLKHFTNSQRVKFHYLLKGRYGAKGILKETEGSFLGTGTIMVPVEKEDLLKEIFDQWQVKYTIQRILLG